MLENSVLLIKKSYTQIFYNSKPDAVVVVAAVKLVEVAVLAVAMIIGIDEM